MDGESAVSVAARYRLSGSSVSRHRQRHLASNVFDRALAGPEYNTANMLEVALASLNTARSIATAASQTGRSSLLLQAVASIRECVRLVAELGGADGAEDVIEDLRGAEAMAKAIGHLIRENPEAGPVLADRLEQLGQPELAHALRRAAATRALEKGK